MRRRWPLAHQEKGGPTVTLPDATLRDIIDRAKKATEDAPPPWTTDGWSEKVSDAAVMYADAPDPDIEDANDWLLLAEMRSGMVATFIASCDPSTVTAMAEELLAARRGGYLPMDCPNCGRLRLEWRVEGDRIFLKCEKCGATGFDCDEAEHERGGPHTQTGTYDATVRGTPVAQEGERTK